jgi:hypothetical protein
MQSACPWPWIRRAADSAGVAAAAVVLSVLMSAVGKGLCRFLVVPAPDRGHGIQARVVLEQDLLWGTHMRPSLCATQAVKLPDCMPVFHTSVFALQSVCSARPFGSLLAL